MSQQPSAHEGLITAEITRHWDQTAARYDNWLIDADGGQLGRSPAEINAWRLVWRRVLGPPPRRVLDVGTGTGMVALLLALLGYQVTAVDAAERMLDTARRKADKAGLPIEFHHGLANQLPFPDNRFDAAVCRLLMQTLLEPEAAVGEWRRCVRPGGHIAAVGNDYHRVTTTARLRLAALDAVRRRRGTGNYSGDLQRAAQLPLWHAAPQAFGNVFIRAGLERVLLEDLVGTDALESRRARDRLRPWVPHFLVEGTVPAVS